MGYASWNNIVHSSIGNNYIDDEDDNIQWEEPLIFRFSGIEYKVYVYYDRYRGIPKSVIKYAGKIRCYRLYRSRMQLTCV